MARPFAPGFRISVVDILFLVLGTVLAGSGWTMAPAIGICLACPFIAFFLFCNVFRIRRLPELVWTGCFLVATPAWLLLQVHMGWYLGVLSAVLVVVIGNDMRHPGYHGVLWTRVNPGLRDWHGRHQIE